MTRKIIASLIILVLLITGGVVAYQLTKQDSHDDSKLTVTASYYPLYDFARQVGGDKVSVVNMTPAGAEPHDYEPAAKELIQAHDAKVFIYNGGPMEPWVDGFLKDYKHIKIAASKDIELLEADHDHDHEDEDHSEDEHSHEGGTDPHFWLDPVLAQQIVNTIRDGFSQADPDNAGYYEANAASYNQRLNELNRSFAEGLSRCTLDTAISSHAAFSYVAHRYNFHVESIAGIEPDEEPSAKKMAELTNLVKQKGIKYIFFESLVSPKLAETIANETGAGTLVFDPIEGLLQADQDKGKDYLSVQYDNLANLKKALECN